MPIMSPEQLLKLYCAADTDPILSDSEIHTLLHQHQRAAEYNTWAPGTAYEVGNIILPSPRNGQTYVATVAGTSGSSQPAFDLEFAQTYSDGTVTWAQGEVEDSYNINAAAAEGWRWKAGKASDRTRFRTDVTEIHRQQVYEHCIDQMKLYVKRSVAGSGYSIPVSVLRGPAYDPVIGNLNPSP